MGNVEEEAAASPDAANAELEAADEKVRSAFKSLISRLRRPSLDQEQVRPFASD
jgi:hypothetical protein